MRSNVRMRILIGILASSFILAGCGKHRRTHERLHGTLWIQSAVEYRIAAELSYQRAKEQLEPALTDPSWTAALEQQGGYEELPPAVILDLDETVLDNSRFQSQLITNDIDFERTLWNQWVRRAEAAAVPGALDFVKYARSKGVEVFYVTNRYHELERYARENLERLGFPLANQRDTVLTQNEPQYEGRDKSSRRESVARSYRILLLIGDDLNDFISGASVALENRVDSAMRYRSYWGERWILLPNPIYGSWENATYEFDDDLLDAEKLEHKYEKLRPFE
jgi:acid phosphatase